MSIIVINSLTFTEVDCLIPISLNHCMVDLIFVKLLDQLILVGNIKGVHHIVFMLILIMIMIIITTLLIKIIIINNR